MDLCPDFREMLVAFERGGVRYALIGGYAVGHHAKPRATKDLDLLVSGAPPNLDRVAEALAGFGAPRDVVEAARRLRPDEVVYLGIEPVRIDILRTADGIDTEQVIARAERVALDETLTVSVVGLADLIANKRAAGRPQDLADVALLERVNARAAGR